MRQALLILVLAIGCASEAGDRGVSAATGASGASAAPHSTLAPPSRADDTQGGETKGCVHPIHVTPTPGQCNALPADYGLSPQYPLEWGFGSMLGVGGDALLCENGGRPSTKRLGSLGAPPEYRPTAPRSGSMKSDMIDHYRVICPGDGAPHDFYVNAYRCGLPCFPRGFRAMQGEAFKQLSAARTALDQDRMPEALAHAQRARELEPGSELVHASLGTALFVNERYAEAFVEFQQASAIDATNPYYRLHAAMSKLATGDARYYRTVVEELLAELPQKHPLIDELHCRHAHALRRDGELDRAKPLAARACTAGQKECCW